MEASATCSTCCSEQDIRSIFPSTLSSLQSSCNRFASLMAIRCCRRDLRRRCRVCTFWARRLPGALVLCCNLSLARVSLRAPCSAASRDQVLRKHRRNVPDDFRERRSACGSGGGRCRTPDCIFSKRDSADFGPATYCAFGTRVAAALPTIQEKRQDRVITNTNR